MARGGCDLGRSPPLAPHVWDGEVQAFPRREAWAVAMRMPRLRSSKLRSPIRAFAVERLTHDCPADLVLRRSRPRHLYARSADTAQSVHLRTRPWHPAAPSTEPPYQTCSPDPSPAQGCRELRQLVLLEHLRDGSPQIDPPDALLLSTPGSSSPRRICGKVRQSPPHRLSPLEHEVLTYLSGPGRPHSGSDLRGGAQSTRTAALFKGGNCRLRQKTRRGAPTSTRATAIPMIGWLRQTIR
jgi:hypothetical protein